MNTIYKCPDCGLENGDGWSKGIIDIPPLDLQIEDARFSRKRVYEADYCWCPNCHREWEVVAKSEIVE